MLTIEMLPAGFGDCIWIEYGEETDLRRILIDGGIASTYYALQNRILRLPAHQRRFEVFIITHIDADHIEGAIKLIGSMQQLGVTFVDVWFNGWRHLPETIEEESDDWLGGVQGEFLSSLMERKELPWNRAFSGAPVVVPDEGSLPRYELEGGMSLTLLSPIQKSLIELRGKWAEEVRAACLDKSSVTAVLEALQNRPQLRVADDLILSGERHINVKQLANTQFVSDDAKANGSSIAVLAEYDGKRCLLTGDAHATILDTNVKRLLKERETNRLDLDVFKLPHHGSKGNINVALLEQLNCKRYLFSTNGKRFRHPDWEAVSRVIVYGGQQPSLIFNYLTDVNKIWDTPELMGGEIPYKVHYPYGNDGIVIKL